MRKIFSMLAALILISGFSSFKGEQDNNNIYLEQGGKKILLKGYDEVVLERKPFTFHFFNRAYSDTAYNALCVAEFMDKAWLNKVQAGDSIENVPFFSAGTGMAEYERDSSTLFFNDEGHHYLYYQNDTSHRVGLIRKLKNGQLELKWTIYAVYRAEKDIPFTEAGIDTFYMVVFKDSNLNGVVDKKEFHKITIRFK